MKKLIISAALAFSLLGSSSAMAHKLGDTQQGGAHAHGDSWWECFEKEVKPYAFTYTLSSSNTYRRTIRAAAALELCHYWDELR